MSAHGSMPGNAWMRTALDVLSRHNLVTKTISFMLGKGRWAALTGLLKDGRICLANNAAERALRGVALGRKTWPFAGSERGRDRAAFMYTRIVTAKMNDIDPQAWLADVLARFLRLTDPRVLDLLPWNWQSPEGQLAA